MTKCSNCGSPDAIEIRRGKHKCVNCGIERDSPSLSKDDRSRSITEEDRSRYCKAHGNKVQFLCQVCKDEELCPKCDVMNSDWEVTGLEYGYMVARNSSPQPGPRLYKEDIIPLLEAKHGKLYHVSPDCLGKGAPAAFAAITSGKQCEYPGCGSIPNGRCRCCNSAFCKTHLLSRKESSSPPRSISLRSVDNLLSRQVAVTRTEREHGKSYTINVAGFCEMCASEQAQEAAIKVHDRAQLYHVELNKIGAYQPHASIFLRALGELRPLRERMIIKRFGRMIEMIIQQAEKDPGSCCRDHYFPARKREKNRVPSNYSNNSRLIYKIVDQRGEDLLDLLGFVQ